MRRFRSSRLLLSLCLAAGLAVSTVASFDAFNFWEDFFGPSSPTVTFDAGKWSYTPNGLYRSQSNNGNIYYTPASYDRQLVVTTGDFYNRDFTYELTYQATDDNNTDLAFVGFGGGVSNPNYFNEPTNYIGFRIHNRVPGVGGRIDMVVANGFAGSQFTTLREGVGTYTYQTDLRFRIARTGDTVTLAILDPQDMLTPLVSQDFSIAAQAPFLGNGTSRLFFGNSATGGLFLAMSVQSTLAVSDADGDGVNDGADACPATAAGAAVNAAGCSGAQNVAAACAVTATWKNHGQYVSCVSQAANAQKAAGLLTDQGVSDLVSKAARSYIGRK